MKISILLICIITAIVALSFFGAATSQEIRLSDTATALEEWGPFDRSNLRCQTMTAVQCVVLLDVTLRNDTADKIVFSINFTVGEFVSLYTTRPFTEIQQLNGWKEGEVVPSTILPKGKMIVISGSI